MARITENPKFIGLGILLSLGIGIYLYFPDFWKQITAPPRKPKAAAATVKLSEEESRFYRMIPDRLPDKAEDLLVAREPAKTIFDEVPRRQKTNEEKGEAPPIPASWRLSSIFVSSNQRAAVISGQALVEGDMVGPFTVVKIEADRVVLRHPLGERVLKFSQAAPADTSSSPEALPPAKAEKQALPPGLLRQAIEGVKAWQRNQEALDQLLPPNKP